MKEYEWDKKKGKSILVKVDGKKPEEVVADEKETEEATVLDSKQV